MRGDWRDLALTHAARPPRGRGSVLVMPPITASDVLASSGCSDTHTRDAKLTACTHSEDNGGGGGDDTCPTCGLKPTVTIRRSRGESSKPNETRKKKEQKDNGVDVEGELSAREVLELQVKVVAMTLPKKYRAKWARSVVRQVGGIAGIVSKRPKLIRAVRARGGAMIPSFVASRIIAVLREPRCYEKANAAKETSVKFKTVSLLTKSGDS